MKPIMVMSFAALLFIFAACSKSNSSLSANTDHPIVFSVNGNAAVVTKITIDTNRYSSAYPWIDVNGVATIDATKDTLDFEFQLFSLNPLNSANKFMGLYSDTASNGNMSLLNMSSRINFNYYANASDNHNYLVAKVTSNDGKIVQGTFSGGLQTYQNNTGAPDSLVVTGGAFRLDLTAR